MGGLLQLPPAPRSPRWADSLRAALGKERACQRVTEVLRPYIQVVGGQGRNRTTDTWIFKRPRLQRSNPSAAHSSRQRSVPWSAYLPGFTNLSVIRSDSPIARYLSRSFSPSASVGGRVHTPSG